MNKNEAIEKINKIGNVGYIIGKIAKIIIIIGFVGALVGAIACTILPKNLLNVRVGGNATVAIDLKTLKAADKVSESDLQGAIEEISKGELDLADKEYAFTGAHVDNRVITFDGEAKVPQLITIKSILGLCIMALFLLAAVYVTLIYITRLCKALKVCVSPFEENVVASLTAFSYSLIPYAVIASLCPAIVDVCLGSSDSIFVNINSGVVLVVIALICLSFIFKYGAALQKESDETL